MKFKIGDRVRYIGDYGALYNKVGVVRADGEIDVCYAVAFDGYKGHTCRSFDVDYCPDGNGMWCSGSVLELVEEDVKKEEKEEMKFKVEDNKRLKDEHESDLAFEICRRHLFNHLSESTYELLTGVVMDMENRTQERN